MRSPWSTSPVQGRTGPDGVSTRRPRRRGRRSPPHDKEGRGTMAGNGKVALVTGAGSGIGRAAALALLREGYAVALAGRRAEALEATRAAAGSDGARAMAVLADVSAEPSVRALFEEVRAAFGRLDLLFN